MMMLIRRFNVLRVVSGIVTIFLEQTQLLHLVGLFITTRDHTRLYV